MSHEWIFVNQWLLYISNSVAVFGSVYSQLRDKHENNV